MNMGNPFESDEIDYGILVNADGQYCLWPAFREVPGGWAAVGVNGRRQDCLDWIESNWTDMRPNHLIKVSDSANPLDGD